MIIESARLAVANLLAPDMRRLVWKVLGLSIAVLICFWLALQAVVATYGVSLLHYFSQDCLPGSTGWPWRWRQSWALARPSCWRR